MRWITLAAGGALAPLAALAVVQAWTAGADAAFAEPAPLPIGTTAALQDERLTRVAAETTRERNETVVASAIEARPPVSDEGERQQREPHHSAFDDSGGWDFGPATPDRLARAAADAEWVLSVEERDGIASEIEARIAERRASAELKRLRASLEDLAARFPGTAAGASAEAMTEEGRAPVEASRSPVVSHESF